MSWPPRGPAEGFLPLSGEKAKFKASTGLPGQALDLAEPLLPSHHGTLRVQQGDSPPERA